MSSAKPHFTDRFASRLDDCGTEDAFVVLAQAKALEAQGRDIVHLQIGEPDFDTPRNIIDKAHWALDHGYTHYTGSAGAMEHREKYAEYVCQRYGVEGVTGENVIIYPGAKPIVFLTAMALVNPGDEVIIFDPTYPGYEAAVQLMGGVIKRLPLTEDTGFRFDHEQLKQLVSSKTKLFYLNTPQNPTGGVLTQGDLDFVAELARAVASPAPHGGVGEHRAHVAGSAQLGDAGEPGDGHRCGPVRRGAVADLPVGVLTPAPQVGPPGPCAKPTGVGAAGADG